MSLPNFLIVGAAKSGTTTLYHLLSQHPDVYMPSVKEPCYFSDGMPEIVFSDEEYEALFADRTIEKAAGEASATYLFDPLAPDRIKRLLRDPKILIMLRNPADAAYSLWGHNVFQQGEEDLSFDEALRQEEPRMNSRVFRETRRFPYTNYYYFNRGLYYEQVKRYIDTFGRENVLVMIFEEFVADPASHCRKVFEFIGVDPEFVPAFESHNVATTFKYGFLHRFLVTPPAFLIKFYNTLPVRIRMAVYKAAQFVYGLNVHSKPRPPMDKDLRESLMDSYMADIRRLEELLGRDISIWYE